MNQHDHTDLRPIHRSALEELSAVVGSLTPELMTRRTPCPAWDVRELVEHVVGLNLGFAQALRTGSSEASAHDPRPVALWQDSVDLVVEAFAQADDERVVYVAPISPDVALRVGDALAAHLLDVLAHTWDLCAALGVEHRPREDAVAAVGEVAALVAARSLPSTREQFAAPIRSAAGDGTGWRHVLRLLGRDPQWRPAGDAATAPALEPIGIAERLGRFTETWSPKIIGRVNDYEVKVVKMLGEFEWHTHHDTDELFVVVTGAVRIEMRHGSVALAPGDLYVVPRGVEHRPVAEVLTECVLLEPAGVVNTGDAGGALTAVDEVLV